MSHDTKHGELTETVTVQRPVGQHIRDLVLFAREIGHAVERMTDEQLIAAAKEFWDEQHGED